MYFSHAFKIYKGVPLIINSMMASYLGVIDQLVADWIEAEATAVTQM